MQGHANHLERAFLVCAVAFWGAALAEQIPDSVNLLPGGDFEDGLREWWPPSKEGTFLDEQIKHGGKQSLRLERGVKSRHVSRGFSTDLRRCYPPPVWIRFRTPGRMDGV